MTASTGRVLQDTNLLIYSLAKQQRAMAVVLALRSAGVGCVSTQVLAEFFSASTRKIRPPLRAEEALGVLREYLQMWIILEVTGAVVLEAARVGSRRHLNYWDAQIWAAARLHKIPVILSEDFRDGSVLEGVRFVNPFAPAFSLADWV